MDIDDLYPMVENLHEFVHIRGGVDRLRSAVLEMAISGALVPAIAAEGSGKDLAAELSCGHRVIVR